MIPLASRQQVAMQRTWMSLPDILPRIVAAYEHSAEYFFGNIEQRDMSEMYFNRFHAG
jgi:hypothetical protein